MKKRYLLLATMLISCLLKAQLNFDLNTGQSPNYGDPDPNWTHRVGPFGPDLMTFTVLPLVGVQSLNTFVCNSDWISPTTSLPGPLPTGTATPSGAPGHAYRYEFNIDNDCGTITSAFLHMNYLDTDEQLLQMRVNPGPTQLVIYRNITTTPPPVHLVPPASFTTNLLDPIYPYGTAQIAISTGTNILEILTYNATSTTPTTTGLKICADIAVTCCNPLTPSNLQTSSSGLGVADLNWTDNSPISLNTYDVQYRYNDPNCAICPGSNGTVTVTGITSTNYSFPVQNGCFSWKVRSVCSDGTAGEWSDVVCGYTPLPPQPPQPRLKSPSLNEIEINEEKSIAVLPNPSNGVFNLTVNGYDQFDYNVLTINGKQIIDRTSASGNSVRIDLSNQPNGMYFLMVVSGNDVKRVKLIKDY